MAEDSERAWWSPAAPAPSSDRLPVPVEQPHADGHDRPQLGLDQDGHRRLERRRRVTTIIGLLLAIVGIATFVIGFVLDDDTPDDQFDELQNALVLQNEGQLDEAAAIYRAVIEADPTSTIAHFNLAVIDHTKGNTSDAATSYLEVVELDPDYVPALFNLAVLRAEAGDPDSAIELYRRVIELEPNQASALLNLGILLLQAGHDEEASRLISRAIEINPALRNSGEAAPQQ